jgi:hypothetical protein
MTSTVVGSGVDRRLAAVAAVVMLVGCLLPWFAWAGDLPSVPRPGWEGSGVLVAIAAVGALVLLALPWASRDTAAATADGGTPRGGSVLDGPLPWVLLVGLAIVGLVVWPTSWLDSPQGLLPDRAPGLYVAVVGTVLLAVAVVRRGSRARRR